jgi:hypothetical protein
MTLRADQRVYVLQSQREADYDDAPDTNTHGVFTSDLLAKDAAPAGIEWEKRKFNVKNSDGTWSREIYEAEDEWCAWVAAKKPTGLGMNWWIGVYCLDVPVTE